MPALNPEKNAKNFLRCLSFLVLGLAAAGTMAAVFVLWALGQHPVWAQFPAPAGDSTWRPPQMSKAPSGKFANGVFVAHPKDGSQISAASTFVIGAVEPGAAVTINGAPVRVNGSGFFAHVVRLSAGNNQFVVAKSGSGQALTLQVRRPTPQAPLAASPLAVLTGSVEPHEHLGVSPGDVVAFGLRASPGAAAKVVVGGRTIALKPVRHGGGGLVNLGLSTAFGLASQHGSPAQKDLYTGFYRIQPSDKFDSAAIKFIVSGAGATRSLVSPGRLTVVAQPSLARTRHDDTVVRLGPGLARTTPLVAGVRLLLDGWRGQWRRAELSPGRHVWIEDKDLAADDAVELPPSSAVTTVNIEKEGTGARIVIPLAQRLPYQIEQHPAPAKLVLKIFGATADTDFITPAASVPAGSAGAETQIRTFPDPEDMGRIPVNFITWSQLGDRVYQLTVNLSREQQWGFWADYRDTSLVLHVKGAPNVVPGSLSGLTVCIDPGHGGSEPGSCGCSGILESEVNLAIASRVRPLLEAEGARVIMTRSDDVDVTLSDRCARALAAGADLLVSIHNNSLPDGGDPARELGTSSYWYHPQAVPLARACKDSVRKALGFPDFGTRYQNLALCRPSALLACLIEVGFMINPDEYAVLIQPQGQEAAARGVVLGIKDFIADALAPPARATVAGKAGDKSGDK